MAGLYSGDLMFHGQDVIPATIKAIINSNQLGFPVRHLIIKLVLAQVANALIKSKKNPEFTTHYRRIKAYRGHKKTIIAIHRMIQTTTCHILTDLKPYTLEGFLRALPYKRIKSTDHFAGN